MVKTVLAGLLIFTISGAGAQTLINQGSYDSKTLVDTNSTSVSTSTVNTTNTTNSTSTATSNSTVNSTNNNTSTNTNTNTNHNIQSGTVTNNNNNVNSGTVTYNNNNVNSGTLTYNNNNNSTSTNTNHNINSGTMTYNNNNVSTSTNTNNNHNTGDMTNRNINTTTSTNNNIQSGSMTNINQNTSASTSTNTNNNTNTSTAVNQNIQSGEMTNRNINDTNITQRVIQPPPTAIAPTMMSGGNADLCTTGTSGSIQTQIFGVSGGGTVRDLNCERLKLSKTLYDMGMKVAAVATMCQDRRVWDAMQAAGTPCPYEGKIGEQARELWNQNPHKVPQLEKPEKLDATAKKLGIGALVGILVHKLF
jgi:hypothetical protein